MDQSDINAAFMADFSSEESFASAAPGVEFDAMAYGLPIVDKLRDRASALKDYVTLELVLAGARFAFDFATGRIPFPVPQSAKDALWALAENAIRSLYA